MLQTGGRLRLDLEPLDPARIFRGERGKDLQGHPAVERLLNGFVDHSHAAAADHPDDPEIAKAAARLDARHERTVARRVSPTSAHDEPGVEPLS